MFAERANIQAVLDKMTSLVQQMKHNVGSFLSIVCMEVLKMYKDSVAAVKRRIWEEFLDEWKKLETHFRSSRLA